ncbi:MAG: 50S ribosomal protein L29 [Clostridiales bacterium]|nr:50S ribosomal protein L29 [Clostridiales bacterium]
MTAKELRSKSTGELQQELVALKDELFKLRFQHATNQLENPQRLGAVKRDIARVNTILREQELKAN